jgi:hypothetical protein
VNGQRDDPADLAPGKRILPIVQEAGWDPGPVWTDAENLAPTGIWSLVTSRYTNYAIPAHKMTPYLREVFMYRSVKYT